VHRLCKGYVERASVDLQAFFDRVDLKTFEVGLNRVCLTKKLFISKDHPSTHALLVP